MSVGITSFGQPSTVTISSYENGGSQTVSSFGPKNLLRLRSEAGQWSKSGGSIALRGIGARSLLHAKSLRLVQPVQIRFKASGSENLVYPNVFVSARGAPLAASDKQETRARVDQFLTKAFAENVEPFNGLRLAPEGWAKSCESLVLSLNGTSFQCKPKAFLPGLEKLYGDGRYDSLGRPNNCPPYSNATSNNATILNQDGCDEAYRSFIENARVIFVEKGTTGNNHAIKDVVFQIDIVSQLPVGPLIYASYPALSSLTENDLQSLPHIRDLSIEWVYDLHPLDSWFKSVSNDLYDSLAVDMSHIYLGETTLNSFTRDSSGGIDFTSMWESAVVQESIANAAALAAGKYVSLQRPYLTYVLTEPDERMTVIRPSYTLPSVDFTTYTVPCQIQAGQEMGRAVFEYIQSDTMAPLCCLAIFESDKDVAGCTGPRGSRHDRSGTPVVGKRGEMAHDICAPIDFESLKINLTIKNSALGNLTKEYSSATGFDFYRIFLKYSKRKITYADWSKYCRMLVFSPMELCGVSPALVSQPTTFSIDVQFRRTASETSRSPMDFITPVGEPFSMTTDGMRGAHKAQSFEAQLWFMNYQAVTLSPGQCGVSRISFSPQEVDQEFSSASKQLETQVLDQYTV